MNNKVHSQYSSFFFKLALCFCFTITTALSDASPQFYSFAPPKQDTSPSMNPRYFEPIIKGRIAVTIFDILEQDAKEAQKETKTKTNKGPFISFEKNDQTAKQDPRSQNLIAQAPLIVQPKFSVDPEKELLFNPETVHREEPKGNVQPPSPTGARQTEDQTILINFNNVSIIEFLRFISKYSNRNFIFNDDDLKFNVTIVSEEPTTISNVMTALYQVLRIHNLDLIEQGNNMIIHQNPKVNSISLVVSESLQDIAAKKDTEIVTRVFRLNTLEPNKAASIVRPLTSEQSIIEPVVNPNNLIVTDLVQNIEQIGRLLKTLDSPNSGLVIGQYAVKSMTVPAMQKLVQDIMMPLAQGQQLIFVPHVPARSIFVISSPYLVERTLLMMKYIDQRESATQIHNIEQLQGAAGGKKGKWSLDENGNWVFTPTAAVVERPQEINEEELKKLLERNFTKEELERGLTPNEQFLVKQLQRKHELKSLGRELTTNEAILSEKIQRELMSGKLDRTLTPNDIQILNRLRDELMHGKLNRELTPDEILVLKKLEMAMQRGELTKEQLPLGEFFFENLLPERQLQKSARPSGKWMVDEFGKWHFAPEGAPEMGLLEPRELGRKVEHPEGLWELGPNGWQFKLKPGERITAHELGFYREPTEELPVGSIERTEFLIHKLQNRKGDEIVNALDNIAYSLQTCGRINEDLICAIQSVQWIESSNSLIFTGYPFALEKVKLLVYEIDIPARQVYIEMLILETTIDDSLTYGVNWATRFGGGLTAGSQAFLTVPTPLSRAMDTTGSNLFPDPNSLARSSGFNQGVIGESLSKDGILYRSMGALVSAVHNRADTRVVMTPKILVEDNQEAEIFVGINTSFKTQSIANDQGQLLTNNFEFRDVGTTLRITPMISNNDMVTLDIYQESSSVVSSGSQGGGGGSSGGGGGGGGGSGGNTANTENIGPTTRVNKTITRVHVPDGYFLVISGMVQDEDTINRAQVPCLGGVPVIGAFFGNRSRSDSKVNLMIFIRPKIVDSVEEIQHITKHQQDVYRIQDSLKTSWRYGTEEALDFLNIPELCRPGCSDRFLPNE